MTNIDDLVDSEDVPSHVPAPKAPFNKAYRFKQAEVPAPADECAKAYLVLVKYAKDAIGTDSSFSKPIDRHSRLRLTSNEFVDTLPKTLKEAQKVYTSMGEDTPFIGVAFIRNTRATEFYSAIERAVKGEMTYLEAKFLKEGIPMHTQYHEPITEHNIN